MPELALVDALGLRVANRDVQEVRIADTLAWPKPDEPPPGDGISIGTPVTADHAAAYPGQGSLNIDPDGADLLLILLYANQWTGPTATMTVGGNPVTLLSHYVHTGGASNGSMTGYYMLNPGSGVKAVSYSQASPNYQADRTLVAIPVNGVDMGDPIDTFAGFTFTGSGGSVTTTTHDMSGADPASTVIDTHYAYYPTNTPTLPNNLTELWATTVGAPRKGRGGYGAPGSYVWTVDNFNYGVGYAVALNPA